MADHVASGERAELVTVSNLLRMPLVLVNLDRPSNRQQVDSRVTATEPLFDVAGRGRTDGRRMVLKRTAF